MKWLALLSLTMATAIYAAEDKPKAETFLDAVKAGQDYRDQGEYKNDWGAAQIIAPSRKLFSATTLILLAGGFHAQRRNVAPPV